MGGMFLILLPLATAMHYEDPAKGCGSDEQSVHVAASMGEICSPRCNGNVCPSDPPSTSQASPKCLFNLDNRGAFSCGLICTPGSKLSCPTGALCLPCTSALCMIEGYSNLCLYPYPPAPSPRPPPPSPPPPPSSPWPVFHSATSLQADPWGDYYKIVYGSVPGSSFYPLDVGQNWILHDNALIDAKLLSKIPSASTCPSKEYDRYNENNKYQPPSVSWIWHSYPFSAIGASTWAEVIHEQDPFGDESHGMWLQYSPGSGIWFNTGVTISFPAHQDAYTHFKIQGVSDPNSAMSGMAAGAGYDSVQFVSHVDHVSYQCDTSHTGRPNFDYMGLEIVAVKLVGLFPCGTASGTPPVIRRGWHASDVCSCDNKEQFLNCQSVPSFRADASTLAANLQGFIL